jgi:hypothetical protein
MRGPFRCWSGIARTTIECTSPQAVCVGQVRRQRRSAVMLTFESIRENPESGPWRR